MPRQMKQAPKSKLHLPGWSKYLQFGAMATQERPGNDDQPYLERFVWGWAGRTFCGLFINVLGVGWEFHERKSADSKTLISGFGTLTNT